LLSPTSLSKIIFKKHTKLYAFTYFMHCQRKRMEICGTVGDSAYKFLLKCNTVEAI
jgi:hypothetical protein